MKIKLPNTVLFNRSLTEDNRHWQVYAFRLVMLGVILFFLFQIVMLSRFSIMMTAVGRNFFMTTAIINLVFITLFGISLFSTAITEEKEVDSLGLLLMTGISSFSLLFSKNFSKMLTGMMLIITQFPFTILAITIGGISLNQIIAVYITLLCYTFFVANIALFASVISKKSSIAAAVSLALLVLWNVLFPLYDSTRFLSPFYRCYEITRTVFSGQVFSMHEIFILSTGFIFFAISWLIFNNFSRSSSIINISFPKSIRKQTAKFGIFRAGRPWKSPIIWKDFYFVSGGFKGYLAYILLSLFIFCIFLCFHYHSWRNFPDSQDIMEMFTAISVIILGIQLTFLGSSLFSSEVRSGTHSTIMMLPMSLKQIAYRKILGGSLMLLPMVILFFISYFSSSYNPLPNTLSKWSIFISNIMYGTALVLAYLHLATIFSLYVRYGAFAIAALVLLLIQIILLVPLSLFSFSFGFFGGYHDIMQMIYYIIGMAIYLFIIFFGHRRIGKRLVELAGQ